MISTRGLVEGLIFASTHSISKKSISEILELPIEDVEQILEEIRLDFEQEGHGFSLVGIAGGYQFRTKSDLKETMARFYEKKPPRLTQATLEVLSVIAYKQPITRPEIEKIRGVDCTGVLKTLLERELTEMRGRSDLPGHPVVYGTTPKFLEWFQINSLNDLPPLSEMEALNRGRDDHTENVLQFLNRDDGFQSESLADVDETLKSVSRMDPIGYPEDNAAATTGETSNQATLAPVEEASAEPMFQAGDLMQHVETSPTV